MIRYKKIGSRHTLSLSNADLNDMAELVWLLKHTPPPIGYNRKPLTRSQDRIVDELYRVVSFPTNYAEIINAKTGQ